jgi:acyl-CoA thioesterase
MSHDISTPLAAILEFEPTGPNSQVSIPDDWTQGRTTFGGLLAAIALRALAPIAPDRPLRSFAMSCMAPAGAGSLQVATEVLRSGKSLVHARATLSQGGVQCATLLAGFGARRASKLDFAGRAADSGAAPESLVRLPYIESAMPKFTRHFDYRLMPATDPALAGAGGHLGGYVRSLDASRFDVALIAALIDSFPAPILTMLKAPAPVSTATWMVNFTHAQTSQRVADFCRLEADTQSVGEGYGSVEARLWDAQGRLLALSQQLVVEFSS